MDGIGLETSMGLDAIMEEATVVELAARGESFSGPFRLSLSSEVPESESESEEVVILPLGAEDLVLVPMDGRMT